MDSYYFVLFCRLNDLHELSQLDTDLKLEVPVHAGAKTAISAKAKS